MFKQSPICKKNNENVFKAFVFTMINYFRHSLTLLCVAVLILGGAWCAAPTYSLPADMLIGRVILLNNVVTTGSTVNTAVTYSTAFGSVPDLCWGINGLGFIPGAFIGYRLETFSQNAASFNFRLIIGTSTTLEYVSVRYMAFLCSSYLELKPNSATLSCAMRTTYVTRATTLPNLNTASYLGSTRAGNLNLFSTVSVHNTVNNARPFMFLIGIFASTVGDSYLIDFFPVLFHASNQRHHYVAIKIGMQNLLISFAVNYLVIDEFQTSIAHNLYIAEYDVTFRYGIVTGIVPTFNPVTEYFIIGVKSMGLINGQAYGFIFNNQGSDIVFGPSLPQNAVTFIGITKMFCGIGEQLNRARYDCFTDRNGCPFNYQILPTPSLIKQIIMHQDNSLLAVLYPEGINFYIYNSMTFLYELDSNIAFADFKNGVNMKISRDFSKIVVCGFQLLQIWGWDGSEYSLMFNLPMQSRFIHDFSGVSISKDGSTIVVGYYMRLRVLGVSEQRTLVLQYDTASGTFKEISEMNIQKTTYYGFILGNKNKIFTLDNFNYNVYEKKPGSVHYQKIMEVSSTSLNVYVDKVAENFDGKVIAIYGKNPSSFTSDTHNGISILQYDVNLGYHTYFQFIPNIYSSNLYGGGISLNADGTVLAIQHNSPEMSVQSIWKRASTSDDFQMDETLTAGILTTTTDLFLTSVALSPDGKVLAGIQDKGKDLIFYFCDADIGGPYTIPTATLVPSSSSNEEQLREGQSSNADENSLFSWIVIAVVGFETLLLLIIGSVLLYKYCKNRGKPKVEPNEEIFDRKIKDHQSNHISQNSIQTLSEEQAKFEEANQNESALVKANRQRKNRKERKNVSDELEFISNLSVTFNDKVNWEKQLQNKRQV